MTGSEIKEIRESLGLTQFQLAKELKVDRVTVSRWEAGNRNIHRIYEAQIKMINGVTQQAEAKFVILLDKFGAFTTRDIIASNLTMTEEDAKKYGKEGMVKINK